MRKISLTVVGLICLLFAASASAEESETATGGYYAGFYAGYGQTHDSELRIEGYPPGTLLFEPGYRLGGVAGYDFTGPLRVELDVAWRTSDIDGIEVPVVGKIGATVEYRLFGAIGPEFIGAGNTKVEADYIDSAFSLGLRMGF